MIKFGTMITVTCMAISACTPLPDSVAKLDATSTLSPPTAFQKNQLKDSQILGGLFDVFQDDILKKLVEEALHHNLDLQFAAKQLEEAGFHAGAKRGDILPQLRANISVSQEQGAQGKSVESYAPSLDASWEIDVWGKMRDQKASLDAKVQASIENHQFAQDSIAAQVMQGWFDVVTAKKQVVLEQSRLKNLEKNAKSSLSNYEVGLGLFEDVNTIHGNIAQSRATLAMNINNQNTALRTLQILMGKYPDGDMVVNYTLPPLLAPPRAGVPADLLSERPDLRRAWLEVLAADASVKAAHKEMFPSFSLTGSLGKQSFAFSNFMRGATVWSFASNLALPIFQAGKLKNQRNAAQSRAEQAWVNYLKTALTAFGEVEQALDRESLLAEKEQGWQRAVIHAEKTARVFEGRYKKGLVNILDYLTAQNRVFDMRAQLLYARNERLKNRIALALALGKGV